MVGIGFVTGGSAVSGIAGAGGGRVVAVPEPPPGWFGGVDSTGRVVVRLDGGAREVQVELRPGWRGDVGGEGLGPAVTAAFAAAAAVRLQEWATGPAYRTCAAPPADPGPARLPDRRAADERVTAVLRARRDLREYALNLTDLMRTPQVVTSPCGRVRVQVVAGQVVAVVVDARWAAATAEAALIAALRAGLRQALRVAPGLGERALSGCPDLRDLLGRASTPARAAPRPMW